EVNVYSDNKDESEEILKNEIQKHLDQLSEDQNVMLKLSILTVANLYKPLIDHPRVVRVVALSGGYSREEANEKLKDNDGLIASFGSSLASELKANESDEKFNKEMKDAVDINYNASVNKK